MRKIQGLLAFITVVSLVLITGLAFAEDVKAQGQPFQALQQQIDELKQQVQDMQLNMGNYYTKTEVDALLAECCGAKILFSQISAGWGLPAARKAMVLWCAGHRIIGGKARRQPAPSPRGHVGHGIPAA